MAARIGTKPAPPASSRVPSLTPETTPQQRALIRDVFITEFGGAYTDAVDVRTPELFRALTTRRLDDPDPGPDTDPDIKGKDKDGHGPLHAEVLKNTIDLLQRFSLCAPVFPRLGAGGNANANTATTIPENMKNNAHALFWRATFCRYFCADIPGLADHHGAHGSSRKVWCDVRRLVVALRMIWDNDPSGGREVPNSARLFAAVAATMTCDGGGGGAYEDEARPLPRARRRGAVASLLWELMGTAARGLREEARLWDMRTWAVEVTARVGLWRKKEMGAGGKGLVLREPVFVNTGVYPRDVLPEYSEGEYFLS